MRIGLLLSLLVYFANAAPTIKPKSFLTVSHSSFPKHTMRYTEPDRDLCDPSVKQYSGYLDVAKDKHLFFWFFEARNDPHKAPVMLWLNGGPGCSSMTGLFLELGPCRVNRDGSGTTYNPYSWNNNVNVIFLDQPINVGYSYGNETVSSTVTAADDVYAFLQLFYKKFPEYRDNDFYVAGESYGGHYVPAVATAVIKGNSNLDKQSVSIPLKSILVGNGLTDPLIQYGYYEPMACNSSYGAVLDSSTCKSMSLHYPTCKRLIQTCYDKQTPAACTKASSYCDAYLTGPYYSKSGRSPYDVRQKCSTVGQDLCDPLMTSLQTFLNRPDVRQKMGADTSINYENCNDRVNYQFGQTGDWMRPYVNDVPYLLKNDVRILIYAGDADFICNWMGNKAWLMALRWSGQDDFTSAEDHEWVPSGESSSAGQLRATEDGKLAFLRVYAAGHTVPEQQPKASLAMVNSWIAEKLK